MIARSTFTLIFIASSLTFSSGQIKKLITDQSGNAVGEFEMLLIKKDGPKEQPLLSENAEMSFQGKQKGEFSVRFQKKELDSNV